MSNLDNDTLFGFVSSALISLGGVFGFLRRGSVASLVAGGGSGALLAYGVHQQRYNNQNVQVVVGVSALLAIVMGLRFVRGRKFMPAGLVTVLSLALLYRFGQRLA
ncbi:hypothetical protein Rt10032_c02g0800 [Rhodotorula toruloides]|uniref:Transmembrane protein 14C n=1 Tax=Rhodotorula toruloides TaxID=5286 RepID=A0A511K8W1_RHOTO|nr:hypothetical protein Rt10032_c02g0800 [Rhodotorula toruloides]